MRNYFDEPNDVKLRRVRKYFLSPDSVDDLGHKFYTCLIEPNEDESGYYFSLIGASGLEYSTVFDNIYIQHNTYFGIIDAIAIELKQKIVDLEIDERPT